MFRKTEVNMKRRVMRRLVEAKWSNKEIAALFDVSPEQVSYQLKFYRRTFYRPGRIV